MRTISDCDILPQEDVRFSAISSYFINHQSAAFSTHKYENGAFVIMRRSAVRNLCDALMMRRQKASAGNAINVALPEVSVVKSRFVSGNRRVTKKRAAATFA